MKALIRESIPFILYTAGMLSVAVSFYRRSIGLYILVLILPLTNVRAKINELPQGNNLIDFLILALVISILFERFGSESLMPKLPQHKLMLAYGFLTYLFLWWGSLNIRLPLPLSLGDLRFTAWKNHILCLLVYVLVLTTIRTKKQIYTVLGLMALTFTYAARLNMSGAHTSGSFRWDKRSIGIFNKLGPNEMAAFFSDYIFIPIGYVAVKTRWLLMGLLVCLTLFAFNALLFTYSRGAYMALVAGLLVVILARKWVMILPLMVIVPLFLATWQTILPAPVVERITMTQTDGELESSSAGRVGLWQHGLQLSARNPLGYGYGTVSELGFRGSRGQQKGDVHNKYIEVLVETGVIGVTLFIGLIVLAIRSGIRLFRTAEDPLMRALGLGFLGCSVSMLVTNIFGDRWTYLELASYFWVLWALVERGYAIELAEQEQAEEDPKLRAVESAAGRVTAVSPPLTIP